MDMTVKNRAVFFIGGYDPKTAEGFFTRMQRELRRFEQTWGTVSTMSAISDLGETASARFSTTLAGAWRTDTDFTFLVLDGIVADDFARPLPVRVLKYLVAFFDYVFSGTYFAMLRKSWRFSLYFLYPFLAMLLFAVLGVIAASLVARLSIPHGHLLAPIVGLAVFAVLLATLGRRWAITHLMDLWSFSLNFLRGRRPDAEALMQRFAQTIVAHAKANACDEILLIGHSTGGGMILNIAARCLRIDPDFAGRSREVSLLTLGSTALKLGLHPAAGKFRADVQSLVDEPRLKWAEFQCLTDVINFYRTDPVRDMKLRPRPAGVAPFPVIRHVRIRNMLADATYKRIKHNFFRVHYQFVFGNTKRYFYDFFMVCFGPQPLSTLQQGSDPKQKLVDRPQ